MPKIMTSILLVALFAGLAGNLHAQGISFQPAVNFTITPPGCPGVCFGPAVNYPAGFGPWSVAVGDFNGDGLPDLAVANAGSNNVSVYLDPQKTTRAQPSQ